MSVMLEEAELIDLWGEGEHNNAITTTIQTTLYDLIAALNDAVEPGEDALVITTVVQWLRAGRIKRFAQQAGSDTYSG